MTVENKPGSCDPTGEQSKCRLGKDEQKITVFRIRVDPEVQELELRIQSLQRELEAVKVQLVTANKVANMLLDERDAKRKSESRLLNFRGTKISIEEARKSFELDFNENGYCHSCSWHSLWSEYSIDDWEIIEAVEKNDGCLELPCLSKDKDEEDRHRGVFCYVSR